MNNRQENFGQLVKAGLSIDDADQIQKISRSLHRLDEHSCNGYQDWHGNWDEIAEKKAEQREIKLESKGTELAKKYGFLFYHQSDPRGWSVYLVKPDLLGEYSINAVYDRGIGVNPH